jgi:hypothetical protein
MPNLKRERDLCGDSHGAMPNPKKERDLCGDSHAAMPNPNRARHQLLNGECSVTDSVAHGRIRIGLGTNSGVAGDDA